MPAAAQQTPPPLLSFVQQITSRDGTLLQDSKMVNCYPEQTENGPSVVKRPGLSFIINQGAGAGQGIFNFGSQTFAFYGGTYRDATTNINYGALQTVAPSATQPFFGVEGVALRTAMPGVVKQSRGMWYFNNTGNPNTWSFNGVTDANYPGVTVPGVVSLDYTTYVLDNQGNIRGSNVGDPGTWNPLNSLLADIQLGAPIGIHRHLNYVVGFFDKGIQFYQDNSNPSGSPLSVVQSGMFRTGCVTGYSIVELDDVTYFIGKTANSKGRSICVLDGLQVAEISNPYINKILNAASIPPDMDNAPVRAFCLKTDGHSFYVLTLINSNLTLAYDVTYKHWHIWTSVVGGVEGAFVGSASNNTSAFTSNDEIALIQDATTGAMYSISDTVYQDFTGPINARIVTKPYDWGTMRRKFFAGLYLLADTVASSIAVRHSDDDYTTFSAFRNIDLSTVKKFLLRIGSSRRRSWEFLHTANTPLKLYNAEVPFEAGE